MPHHWWRQIRIMESGTEITPFLDLLIRTILSLPSFRPLEQELVELSQLIAPARDGFSCRFGVPPGWPDRVYHSAGGCSQLEGADVTVLERPLGPQGDLDGLFAVGGHWGAVMANLGEMDDPEVDLRLERTHSLRRTRIPRGGTMPCSRRIKTER